MLIERKGDLFTTNSRVIGHGVNCKGFMRAGIATQFSSRFPDMYHEYRGICQRGELKPGEVFMWETDKSKWVANIASQFRPGNDARYIWAIAGIREALDATEVLGYASLSIPRIGCGIGGLDWESLRVDLVEEFDDHPVDLIVYSL